MRFTVEAIVEATGGRLVGGRADAPPARISTDTRTLEPGDAFVALRGERFDGHAFLHQAYAKRAAALVVDAVETPPAPDAGPAVIEVADTTAALADLGRSARARLTCPVIAVTGSCGKTTLKGMIAAVLGRRLRGTAGAKSFNNAVGVPLTLLAAEEDDGFVLCELGTNAPGEIAALAAVARPTVAAVTVVAPVHLEGLGSLEGVFAEKAALVEALPEDGLAVLNADDPRVAAMAGRCRGRVVTVGLEAAEADLRATDLVQTEAGLAFTVGDLGFTVPVLGGHQAVLALEAVAVGEALGVPRDEAAAALAAFEPLPMRLAPERVGEVLILNDAYNANPRSMEAALALLALWPERRKVFACGEMRELGPASAEAHAALGRAAVEAGVGVLVAAGPETAATVAAAREAGLPPDRAVHVADAAAAAEAVAGRLEPGDVVLVKGSRAMHMDMVVRAVAEAAAAGQGA